METAFLFKRLNKIPPYISAEFHYNYNFIAALQERDLIPCLDMHCSLGQTNKNEIRKEPSAVFILKYALAR